MYITVGDEHQPMCLDKHPPDGDNHWPVCGDDHPPVGDEQRPVCGDKQRCVTQMT